MCTCTDTCSDQSELTHHCVDVSYIKIPLRTLWGSMVCH